MEALTDHIHQPGGRAAERLLILSTVSPARRWDAALVPVEAYRGQQCLLGWDAQLKSFGAMLRTLGVPTLVTPAPEMFFTPVSVQVAAAAAGIDAAALDGAVHIRFGAGRFTRIFRGLPNIIATAEAAWAGVLAPGAHPYRAQNTAPNAVRAMLDLTGQAGPLYRPDGSQIARIAAPRGILGADVPALRFTPRPLLRADFDGLELVAVAEFSAGESSGAPASLQARRLMSQFNGGGLTLEHKMVLLPWNLANPASCVPDVAVKYMRAFAGTARARQLVLLPFNVQRDFAGQIEPLVAGIRRELAEMLPAPEGFESRPLPPAGVMIGHVHDFSGVATLRRMGAEAWVDGADPEAAWTEARFLACRIPVARLPAGTEPTVAELRDEFGQRFFEGRAVAARDVWGLAKLAGRAGAMPDIGAVEVRAWLGELVGGGFV